MSLFLPNRLAALFAPIVLVVPQGADAAPGAGNKVYGPLVTKGEAEIEFRGARLVGGEEGGEGAYVFEGSYGATDWWKTGVVLETENEPAGPLFVEAVEFENIIELPRVANTPINFGIYAEYELNVEREADGIELRWLAEYENGPFDAKANFITERKFGAGETFAFGYGILSSIEIFHDVALGVEAFGDLGDATDFGSLDEREHFVGPVALVELEPAGLPGEIERETGYLFGVGNAEAEGQVRFLVEWEFKL